MKPKSHPATARSFASRLALAIGAVLCLAAPSVRACSACYGQSDSRLAAGMNWGIFSLLGFIGLALGGVAAFAIFLIRRSAQAVPELELEPEPSAEPADADLELISSRDGSVLPRHSNAKVPHNCHAAPNSTREEPTLLNR